MIHTFMNAATKSGGSAAAKFLIIMHVFCSLGVYRDNFGENAWKTDNDFNLLSFFFVQNGRQLSQNFTQGVET